MTTVPEATESVIKRSRYLSEALSKNIINVSSLARYIKPEIEEMLVKKVSISALIMALKRLRSKLETPTSFQNIFQNAPELLVRSNLSLLSLPTSESLKKTGKMYAETIIDNERIILSAKQNGSKNTVSAISIMLKPSHREIPGVYYFFLKSLAWERINILQMFTSKNELIIVVDDKDTGRAFGILKSLFEDLT